MLNISYRHSFCDFVKIPQKFLPLPMLEITTKSTYFLPAKKTIPILWIELQTNKNIKGLKTLHLKICKSGKKIPNCKDFIIIKKQHNFSKINYFLLLSSYLLL